jgi:hypothetical protein
MGDRESETESEQMTTLRFQSFAISSRNSYRETVITEPPSAHFG